VCGAITQGRPGRRVRRGGVVVVRTLVFGHRQKVGARPTREQPLLTSVYYILWTGSAAWRIVLPRPGQLIFDLASQRRPAASTSPGPGRTPPGAPRHRSCFPQPGELIPGLAVRLFAAGQPGCSLTAHADRPASTGHRRARVGAGRDAGHHKDPCTGMGICRFFLAADLSPTAIPQGLSGNAAD